MAKAAKEGQPGGLLQDRLQGKLTRGTLIILQTDQDLRCFALICVTYQYQKLCNSIR